MPLPPDGVFAASNPTSYIKVHSAGRRIEDSIVLHNLDVAFNFTSTGQWRGPLAELVGVVDAIAGRGAETPKRRDTAGIDRTMRPNAHRGSEYARHFPLSDRALSRAIAAVLD